MNQLETKWYKKGVTAAKSPKFRGMSSGAEIWAHIYPTPTGIDGDFARGAFFRGFRDAGAKMKPTRSNPSDSALAGARILGVTRNRAGKVTALKLQLRAGAGGGGAKRTNPVGGGRVFGIATKTGAWKTSYQVGTRDYSNLTDAKRKAQEWADDAGAPETVHVEKRRVKAGQMYDEIKFLKPVVVKPRKR